MKVNVRFVGWIAQAMGISQSSTVAIELKPEATLADLLLEIDSRYHDKFPPNTWDDENKQFHEQVQAFQDGTLTREPESKLRDGAEIAFLVSIAGGQ